MGEYPGLPDGGCCVCEKKGISGRVEGISLSWALWARRFLACAAGKGALNIEVNPFSEKLLFSGRAGAESALRNENRGRAGQQDEVLPVYSYGFRHFGKGR